jgi:hypothetical protein
MTISPTWATARFRSSPRFALKRLDELPPAQRQPFEELTHDAGFYGLLVPRPPSSATIKSVGHEIAALLLALASPAPLDGLCVDRDDVVDLVLDGILEIEHEGDFVCGADALPLVVDTVAPSDGGGGIARLSLDALRYAEDLADDDAETLTRALYLYNRIPMARFWEARFPDRDAVLAHLGAAATSSGWQILPPSQANDWINFHALDRRAVRRGAATYKLYVSPRPENVRDAFEAVVRVLAGRSIDFKIGPNAGGLLRPDKMVAYFGSREELDDVAAALRARLAGCPAHGVPFTAGIGDDGLLSWGLDPPESERALSWLGRESWRLWLATKLGAAIAFAKSSSRGAVEPWRFAIERVRRLGVDIERWTPAETLWRAA